VPIDSALAQPGGLQSRSHLESNHYKKSGQCNRACADDYSQDRKDFFGFPLDGTRNSQSNSDQSCERQQDDGKPYNGIGRTRHWSVGSPQDSRNRKKRKAQDQYDHRNGERSNSKTTMLRDYLLIHVPPHFCRASWTATSYQVGWSAANSQSITNQQNSLSKQMSPARGGARRAREPQDSRGWAFSRGQELVAVAAPQVQGAGDSIREIANNVIAITLSSWSNSKR
jgi:hypothetical protein